MTGPQQPGLLVAGTAVIITGDWLQTTLQAVLIAARSRRHNGLPNNAAHAELTQALADAMAAHGQSDGPKPEELHHFPQEQPTVTIDEAAERLGLSHRQTRRLAPRLGGKIVAGRWLLDQTAINEHKEGNTWTETA